MLNPHLYVFLLTLYFLPTFFSLCSWNSCHPSWVRHETVTKTGKTMIDHINDIITFGRRGLGKTALLDIILFCVILSFSLELFSYNHLWPLSSSRVHLSRSTKTNNKANWQLPLRLPRHFRWQKKNALHNTNSVTKGVCSIHSRLRSVYIY